MTNEENDLVLQGLPVETGSSRVVFKGEDQDNNVSLNHRPQEDNLCTRNAAINIENSSDVIIGTVHQQFHGPVTIYHNLNEGVENASFDESEKRDIHEAKEETKIDSGCSPSDFAGEGCPLSPAHIKVIVASLAFLVTIAIITATVLHFSPKSSIQNANSNGTNSIDNSTTMEILGSGHSFIYRNKWGGRPPKSTKKLEHPVPLVIISHTATDFCTTIKECSSTVRSAQEYHVGHFDSPDVGYNFLIGGDANVYVGRGWDSRNFHRENSIAVCFIGNYLFDELTPGMIDSAQKLLEIGVETGKLSPSYQVIGHNQTFKTQSPGTNVYKVIKKWPHFSPISLYDE